MFSGNSTLSLDEKGRLAIPSRYRTRLNEMCDGHMIQTISPLDRCVWIYPQTEWEIIDAKLRQLSDFDKQSRRTKQMMLGYAEECRLDSHGRIRVPASLKEYAGLEKQAVILGQGNKFELWDESAWNTQHDEWLKSLAEGVGDPSEPLQQLSL